MYMMHYYVVMASFSAVPYVGSDTVFYEKSL